MPDTQQSDGRPGSHVSDSVDRMCGLFREQWSSGHPPSIESVVAAADPTERDELLEELIAVEIGLRRQAGNLVTLDEYLSRFPADAERLRHRLEQRVESGSIRGGPTVTEATRSFKHAGAPDADDPRAKLGRYRLIEVLGAGGFGEVWRAMDPILQREVAVKRLRPESGLQRELAQEFLEEARRLARMDHPRIVPVLDVGEEEGRGYIVSKLFEGGTLSERLNHGPLPISDAASMVADLADALHYAHLNDIIHRDIKPSNILLDGDGRPCLADFGLAISEAEQLQESASTMGTYAYMSPEQARGETGRLDARTDIYSLGVVLYEMLTGRLPYLARSRAQYRDQVINRPPRPLRIVRPDVPPAIEEVCLRCLKKEIDDRYRTAADLAADLRAAAPAVSAPAPPAGASQRRIVALSLGAAAILLVVTWQIWPLIWRRGAGGAPKPAQGPGVGASLASGMPDPAEASLNPRRDRWRSGLLQAPRPVVWIPGRELDSYAFQPDENRFVFRSLGFAMFSCGACEGQKLQLKTRVGVSDWVGKAGVYWGLRSIDRPGSPRAQKALAVYLGRILREEENVVLTIEHLTLEETPRIRQKRVTERDSVDHVVIAYPTAESVLLEVDVLSDRDIRIRVDGQAVHWNDKLLHPIEAGPIQDTEFGVLGFDGFVAIDEFSSLEP